MRTKQTSLRTFLAAFLVAGSVGVACSSQQRSSESTTVAQAPLGRSTADYPANPSVAPPDAAEAPEQQVGPAHPLSSGAIGGATTAPGTNNPNATGPNGEGPNGTTGSSPTGTNPTGVVPVPVPTAPGPNTGPMNPAPGTPANPNTPPSTPSSPNAPAPTPAPNPLPPSGGAPIQGQPNPGTATPPSGGGPIQGQPTPGTPPTGTTPQSSHRGMSTVGARLRESASASASVSPSAALPSSTVAEARGTFQEPLDPYQVRSDGGITPPTTPRDAGPGPGIRNDGGLTPIRMDGGITSPLPRGDGGLR